jgi:hypothetical protein
MGSSFATLEDCCEQSVHRRAFGNYPEMRERSSALSGKVTGRAASKYRRSGLVQFNLLSELARRERRERFRPRQSGTDGEPKRQRFRLEKRFNQRNFNNLPLANRTGSALCSSSRRAFFKSSKPE